MTAAAQWDDDDLAEMRAHSLSAESAGERMFCVEPSRYIGLIETAQNHRKRDELVGSAIGGATTLARVILEIYEGSPT